MTRLNPAPDRDYHPMLTDIQFNVKGPLAETRSPRYHFLSDFLTEADIDDIFFCHQFRVQTQLAAEYCDGSFSARHVQWHHRQWSPVLDFSGWQRNFHQLPDSSKFGTELTSR